MTISRFEGCETGIDANVCRRLVDAETEAGDFDSGIMERKQVCEGELGLRHGAFGVGIIVCFGVCSAFVCCLKMGR